jgi:ammonium transporter, Amt family
MFKPTLKRVLPFLILAIVSVVAIFIKPDTVFDGSKIYVGSDIAWIIVATALVFLMTPGLAFFYGGMVNRKNVLSTMIKSFVAAGIVSVLWLVIGFSMSFGPSIHGIIGNPLHFAFFRGVFSSTPWPGGPTIPMPLFALFQLMFAIITPALVVGAVAERVRFTAYVLFIILFCILIYFPVAHWAWHPDGFLAKMGVLDFAGGTVVHITAGAAALAGAIVLKRRKAHIERIEMHPANVPYVLIGTGLLWFGWFGFNAGSALAANDLAVSAFASTNTAAATAGLTWMFFDVLQGKKPSVLGFCIGAVVGLVAITPGSGFVGMANSAFIGFIAAIISNLVCVWKANSVLDDTLDVFPCHGVGGIVGMLLTGVFAHHAVNSAVLVDSTVNHQGLLYGGDLFGKQFIGMVVVATYSFVVSYVIFKFINFILPLRVSKEDEEIGLDASQHNENYVQGTLLVKNSD